MTDGKNTSNITTADLAHTGETSTEQEKRDDPTSQREGITGESRSPGQYGTTPGSGRATVPAPWGDEPAAQLFSTEENGRLRSRWENIQVGFVDEPRRAVEQGDQLVAETVKRLAEGFAEERQKLERQWDRGDSISTEDLRLALRRYRSFFERLLSV